MNSDVQSRSAGHSRRTRRLWLFALGWSIIAAVLGVRQWQRAAATQQLIAEIEAAGGYADLGRPAWERLVAWLEDDVMIYEDERSVELAGPAFDDAWLETHAQLRPLWFEDLSLTRTRLSDAGVARLLNAHEIKWLDLSDSSTLGSATMAALRAQTRLDGLILDRVALTDDDLAALPLERLFVLSIERTPVTVHGLLELRRCQRLEELWIDGEHLDDESAKCLRSIATLHDLYVMGENVTDEDVRALRGMSQLRNAQFARGNITEEALDELRQSLPHCSVN